MPTTPPRVAAWLDIPDDCRMAAQITADGDVQFTMGDRQDGLEIVFEHEALIRFVALASDVLAQPEPADDMATVASPAA